MSKQQTRVPESNSFSYAFILTAVVFWGCATSTEATTEPTRWSCEEVAKRILPELLADYRAPGVILRIAPITDRNDTNNLACTGELTPSTSRAHAQFAHWDDLSKLLSGDQQEANERIVLFQGALGAAITELHEEEYHTPRSWLSEQASLLAGRLMPYYSAKPSIVELRVSNLEDVGANRVGLLVIEEVSYGFVGVHLFILDSKTKVILVHETMTSSPLVDERLFLSGLSKAS